MATTAVSAPSDIRQNVIDALGHTPPGPAQPRHQRHPHAGRRQAGDAQPRRLGQGPHRYPHDRGSRAQGVAQTGRHDRRTDQRQHRRRAGHRRGGQGLLLHLRHAGQGRPGESRPPARLRRPGGHHADRGRARFARELLLGGRPPDARGAERVPAEPVLQPDEPAHALRNDRSRDLGAERRAGDPLRGRASAPAARSPAWPSTSKSTTRPSRSSAPTRREASTPNPTTCTPTRSRGSARTSGRAPSTRPWSTPG